MKALNRLKAMNNRMSYQKQWRLRLESLPMSRASFCRKHSINESILCRLVSLDILAGMTWIRKIEDALKSEGV
jgi:hypothetical protein